MMIDASAPLDTDANWPAKRRVTLVGAFSNLVLAVGKIVGGVIGHSQALVIDGVHSLSDLFSDVLVLGAARFGARGADENHHYGHARFETLATGLVGTLLLLVAIGFAIDAVGRLLDPARHLNPGWLAMGAAVGSVVAKEWLYQYTNRVASRTRSMLIRANAWHHRSDALSSLVVVIGVTGVLLGVAWLDAMAALVVAGMVLWMGWQFVSEAVAELVDTAVPDEEQARLEQIIYSVDGVMGVRQLRTRRMGGRTVMDVQILLDANLTLARADVIAANVRRELLERDPAMSAALVRAAPWKPEDH